MQASVYTNESDRKYTNNNTYMIIEGGGNE